MSERLLSEKIMEVHDSWATAGLRCEARYLQDVVLPGVFELEAAQEKAQAMVPAVTPEEVAATNLYAELVDACDGVGNGMVNISGECHLLLAALQQARGLAAAEWLAKEGTDEVCARCGFWHICHDDDNPKMGKIGEGDCAKWLVATALAALAAGEPGEPSDGELLDVLEGIARDWWSQDEAGELSLVTMDMPIPESMCPLQEKTTLRDLARAIIAATGGKETD